MQHVKTERGFTISTEMTIDVSEKIKETIQKKCLFEKCRYVVVGLSGGPDSMCLFHVLYNLRSDLNIKLFVVHLNHKFRPGAAEEDQSYVEEICQEYNVPCYSKTVDVNKLAAMRGETSEEAGRNERYKAFDEEAMRLVDKGNPKDSICIVVAQNQNDQVETLLMRIIRGTGPDGLSGIPIKRISESGFNIVRPLLNVDRESIEAYCKINNLNPRIDHTNEKSEYSRNKIRLELIPSLKNGYNPNIEGALIRLSQSATSDKDYFHKIVSEVISKECDFEYDNNGKPFLAVISTSVFKNNHPSISRRIITEILKSIGLIQGIESAHIEAAENAAIINRTGSTTEFPQGYRMRVSYDKAEFYKETAESEKEGLLNSQKQIVFSPQKDSQTIKLPAGILKIKFGKISDVKLNNNRIAIDYESLIAENKCLNIRYKTAGDRITLKGMTGTKKLQDLFVDEKIERSRRDSIPLLVLGPKILWILGVRRSEEFQCTKDTKECLLLEWIPNN